MALVSVEANALGSNKGVEQRGRSELGRSHDINCLQIPSLEELSVDNWLNWLLYMDIFVGLAVKHGRCWKPQNLLKIKSAQSSPDRR